MSGKSDRGDWIDIDDLDCQVSEACELYGIDKLEYALDEGAKKEGGKEGCDADSIVSEDSGKDEVPLQDRINSRLFVVRETESGKMLWKCPIEESDTIADHIATANKLSHRLPCHSFRSMLPPLDEGEGPSIRSPSWLRCCMRGVLFSALQRYLENRSSSHDGRMDRLRFPEHVYCWFATDSEDQSLCDEDRWAFYHGVKMSSESNSECWLAYNLLDDMQGEDFFSFMAHSLANVRERIGGTWQAQFGEVYSCGGAIGSKSHLVDAMQQNGYSLDDDEQWAANIWIPVEICEEIMNQLLNGNLIKSLEHVEELSSSINQAAIDVENSLLQEGRVAESLQGEEPDAAATPSFELFAFVHIMMKTYQTHRKKEDVRLRLMFETASRGMLTDFYDAPASGYRNDDKSNREDLVTVPQLHQILQTVWPSATLHEATLIYREAYDALYPPSQWNKPAPNGINFQGFLVAAERRSLFSRVLADVS